MMPYLLPIHREGTATPIAEWEACKIRDPDYWVADCTLFPNPFRQTDHIVAFLMPGFVSWHIPIP